MDIKDKIELIYTGGGIYIAQAEHKADSNIVFNVDSTLPHCLNKYNMEGQADQYEWSEDNMIFSLDMSDDNNVEQYFASRYIGLYEYKLYHKLRKMLEQYVDTGIYNTRL